MKDKSHTASLDSPKSVVSKGFSPAPSVMSTLDRKDARSQKERDLTRDIKAAMRSESWNKLQDLISEWEIISQRDILAECAIQCIGKERAVGEKTLEYVLKRGPLPGNEYTFSSAILHLAQCEFQRSRHEESTQTLYRALKFIDQNSRSYDDRKPQGAASPTPATKNEWLELKDFTVEFLAILSFHDKNYEETMRLLDMMANYQLVLKPARFAFITLLKAKSFVQTRQPEEALRILQMRQSQEDALQQIGQINVTSSKLEPQYPSSRHPSMNRQQSKRDNSEEDGHESTPSESFASIQACHDLHMTILMHLDREDDAKELFKDFKPDPSVKRPSSFKEFVSKKLTMNEVGNDIVDSWRPKTGVLSRRF